MAAYSVAARYPALLQTSEGAWRTRLYAGIFLILVALHTLVPIERGFPVIQLADGYSVTVTILASLVCFLCLVIESNGAIFKSAGSRVYLQWQCLFAAALLVAATLSADAKPALFVALNYFICFVLNFLILRYLFTHGNRRTYIAIVCTVASAAAVLGLIERTAGYYLPFYRDAFLNFDYAQMSFAMAQTGDTFRVLGPLGSPILHAVVLSLALPFAMELKGALRWIVAGLLIASILLSTAMTGALMMACYAMGRLVGYARKLRVFALIGCALALTAVIGVIATVDLDGNEAQPIQRVIYGDGRNVQARLEMIEMGISKVVNFDDAAGLFVGRGLKSSRELVMTPGAAYFSTFDNAWLTVAYEAGIPAFLFFVAVQIAVLWHLRRFSAISAHWWGVFGWCAAGASFVTLYYSTCNFLWVALVAWLWTEQSFPQARAPQGRARTS